MKVTIKLSDDAMTTVEWIQRKGETVPETINRILETMASTAADFDHFYGPPEDGKGPSGQPT